MTLGPMLRPMLRRLAAVVVVVLASARTAPAAPAPDLEPAMPEPPAEAAAPEAPAAPDPLHVFVMTMGPGDHPFFRFGHNAIWVRDQAAGTDRIYNFGTFR